MMSAAAPGATFPNLSSAEEFSVSTSLDQHFDISVQAENKEKPKLENSSFQEGSQ